MRDMIDRMAVIDYLIGVQAIAKVNRDGGMESLASGMMEKFQKWPGKKVGCGTCKHFTPLGEGFGLCKVDAPDVSGVKRTSDDFCSRWKRQPCCPRCGQVVFETGEDAKSEIERRQ